MLLAWFFRLRRHRPDCRRIPSDRSLVRLFRWGRCQHLVGRPNAWWRVSERASAGASTL